MIAKKIFLVGPLGVGKTSLIRRFVEATFSEEYEVTKGVHITRKEVHLNGEEVHLILWDTEGTDEVHKIKEAYLSGTHGFIYVCDLLRPETYEFMEEHKMLLRERLGNIPIICVGNKADLLSQEEKEEKKETLFFLDMLISAKEGRNVHRLFEKMAKILTY